MCASKRVLISCLCTKGYIDSEYSVTTADPNPFQGTHFISRQKINICILY